MKHEWDMVDLNQSVGVMWVLESKNVSCENKTLTN